jgi:hypothetical protein
MAFYKEVAIMKVTLKSLNVKTILKMKKIKLSLLVFLLTILISHKTYTQNDCSTASKTEAQMSQLSYYGNNAYLQTVNQNFSSFMTSNTSLQTRSTVFCNEVNNSLMVPIQFWVYQAQPNETGLPDYRDLQIAIDDLNETYANNGVMFRFFMLPIQFVTDASALDISVTTLRGSWSRRNDGAIDVHVVNSIDNNAGLYTEASDAIFITRTSLYLLRRGGNLNPNTLAHEVGHYFQLEHTHRNSDGNTCSQEAVSRTRTFGLWQAFFCLPFKAGRVCESNGDALCDTPADPNLSDKSTGCNYTGGNLRDLFGVLYSPDVTNIMSYGNPRSCRTTFSSGQRSIMWQNVLSGSTTRGYISVLATNPLDADQFEPDDSDIPNVPRLINDGESQCHSFNDVWDFSDPVDWLRFIPTDGNVISYRITVTIDALNPINPVGTIRVWNTNNTGQRTNQITTVTSQSGNVRTFDVVCPNINGRPLLIEVTRNGTIAGKYQIRLESNPLSIEGSNSNCNGQVFSISPNFNGSSISWSSSPNITLSNTSGASTTISNSTSSSQSWIQSSLSINGCTKTVRKNLIEGLPNFQISLSEYSLCTGVYPAYLSLYHNLSGSSSRWKVDFSKDGQTTGWQNDSPPNPIELTNYFNFYSEIPGYYYTVTLTTENSSPCIGERSSSAGITVFDIFSSQCGGPLRISSPATITPNPSQGSFDFTYNMTKVSDFSLTLINSNGVPTKVLIPMRKQPSGIFQRAFQLNLQPGLYQLLVNINGKIERYPLTITR